MTAVKFAKGVSERSIDFEGIGRNLRDRNLSLNCADGYYDNRYITSNYKRQSKSFLSYVPKGVIPKSLIIAGIMTVTGFYLHDSLMSKVNSIKSTITGEISDLEKKLTDFASKLDSNSDKIKINQTDLEELNERVTTLEKENFNRNVYEVDLYDSPNKKIGSDRKIDKVYWDEDGKSKGGDIYLVQSGEKGQRICSGLEYVNYIIRNITESDRKIFIGNHREVTNLSKEILEQRSDDILVENNLFKYDPCKINLTIQQKYYDISKYHLAN